MRKATKLLMLRVLGPPYRVIAFVLKAAYTIAAGWWLDPWLQRRANGKLLDDVQANFYFLFSQAQVVKPRRIDILPFDYASVTLLSGNVLFCITRGRGEVNVSLSPISRPGEIHQLGFVIAALEKRPLAHGDMVNDLAAAGNLLRPRLELLNAAFSEDEYPRIKERL
ncbi:MAG TPA: hypothetical protein VFU27_13600 [Terriglobales bacterium]|nr:hypothetical protein [Terriglobales bacterium]